MGWTKGKARPNRAPQRIAKTSASVVAGWLTRIKGAVVERNATRIPEMSEDNFYRFAAYMALIGGCDDPIALNAFDLFCDLLLSRDRAPQTALARRDPQWKATRIYYLQSNLGFLPVTRDGLLKVAAALKAAGKIEDVEQATFSVDAFVKVALALANPEEYVEISKKFGLRLWRIGTVFHPYTHEFWTGVYRGVLGPLADPEYRAAAIASIRTVR
jgi:hypothetical protein